MIKKITVYCVLLIVSACMFAGDVAVFVDEGFSANGEYYVFAQYGTIDKTAQGYAEIYTVDIAANDYVGEGLFDTPASSSTRGKNGHTLYTNLRSANTKYFDSLGLETVGIENILYLNNGSKTVNGKISIQDFESSTISGTQSYAITLTPWYSGNTPSSTSSFFITVEKHDEVGSLIGKQVIGNPDIKRRGVVGYSIEKIMKSPDGESFIFIVEKTVATSSGNSVRYMVETLEVDAFSK